jgi:SAM-dependent methyltransferase
MKLVKIEPESQSGRLIYENGPVPAKLTRWLRWKAAQASGDFLEIGCGAGHLTRELAVVCPHRRIWAVEAATFDKVAEHARYLPNVSLVLCDHTEVDYDALSGISLIIINADTDIDSLQVQTERALCFVKSRKSLRPGCLIWHSANHDRWPAVEVRLTDTHEPIFKLDQFEAAYLDLL